MLPSFIAIRAWAGKRDAEGFAKERLALVDAVAKALVDPHGSIKGTEREPFAVGVYRVRGFEAQFPNGPFVRRLVFLITKDVPFAPPTTVIGMP